MKMEREKNNYRNFFINLIISGLAAAGTSWVLFTFVTLGDFLIPTFPNIFIITLLIMWVYGYLVEKFIYKTR